MLETHELCGRNMLRCCELDGRYRGLLLPQLLPKTLAASERLARLRKQGTQLDTLGMTEKIADNRKQPGHAGGAH